MLVAGALYHTCRPAGYAGFIVRFRLKKLRRQYCFRGSDGMREETPLQQYAVPDFCVLGQRGRKRRSGEIRRWIGVADRRRHWNDGKRSIVVRKRERAGVVVEVAVSAACLLAVVDQPL
jgi:hypothetical protein